MSSALSAVRAIVFSKITRWIVGSFAFLIVAALAVLYGGSSWRLAQTYDAPVQTLRAALPGSAERGERIATTFGCKDCHGTHGRVFFDVPMVGRLVAPDLARRTAHYTDAQLITLLRTGIRNDHTSTLAMPSDAFSSMADSDVADVIAWMRALKVEEQTETSVTSVGPLGRLGVLTGGFTPSAELPRDPAPLAARPDGSDPIALGRYVVKTTCNHCHRMDEEHTVKPGLIAPPVRPMTQSYDAEQFKHLLRTGKALGDRELELMSDVSRSALSRLTDEEIAAIHAYLNTPVTEPAK